MSPVVPISCPWAIPPPWREEGSLGLLPYPRAYSGPGGRGREQGGRKGFVAPCHPSIWPSSPCVALKGLMVLGLTVPGPVFPFRPPPPSIPFLWTSHPVFRFQPTCLSNRRGTFAGAAQALSGQPPALSSGSPAWRALGHCPLGILLLLTPLPPPVPLLGAVCSIGGTQDSLQPPTPIPVCHRQGSGAFPAWGLKCCPSCRLSLG